MQRSVVLTLLILFAGCGKSVLFVTKTGVALDVDTQPPSLDIGYMRQEGVIAPIFEDDRVLPVLTTIGVKVGGSTLRPNHSFATGDSAMVLADALTSSDRYVLGQSDDQTRVPRPRMDGRIVVRVAGVTVDEAAKADVPSKRYFFGTDTSLGIHVQWGQSGVPSAFSIGYKRKELAYIPLMEKTVWLNVKTGRTYPPDELVAMENRDEGLVPDGSTSGTRVAIPDLKAQGVLVLAKSVRLASLIATAHGAATVGSQAETGMTIGQTFATGPAATLLATHPEVRVVLGPSLIPNYDRVRRLSLARGDLRANLAFLTTVYTTLNTMARPPANNAGAAAHVGALLAVDSAAMLSAFPVYGLVSANNADQLRIVSAGLPPIGTWGRIVGQLSNLDRSVAALAGANVMTNPTLTLRDDRPATAVNVTINQGQRQVLQQHLTDQLRMRDQLRDDLSQNATVLQAIEFLIQELMRNP